MPFPPPLVKLALPVSVEGYEFKVEEPVESSVAKTTGMETYPLELVPAVTLTVDPTQIMVPVKRGDRADDAVRAGALSRDKTGEGGGRDGCAGGMECSRRRNARFHGSGDQLIRYMVTPPPHVATGAYPMHPYAQIGDETFRTSLEPIPTLPTRDWSEPDEATVHVLDLNVPAGLHVGYIAADNDPMPETLRQIGIQVDMLDEVAVAFSDLSHYDAIVVGIRAYELRPDLLRMNWRCSIT